MASKYWIKLYHEILDDPKMGRLPDNLWRRTTEFFLVAGETNEMGYLPSIEDLAWRLRIATEILESELIELSEIGIVEKRDGRWFVSKFSQRQAPANNAERQARYRSRQHKEQYSSNEHNNESSDASVTEVVTNHNGDTDTESNTEEESAASASELAPEENPAPSPVVKKKKTPGYTDGQRKFLSLFGAKRFKLAIQGITVRGLEEKYGTEKLLELATWAAKNGMSVGKAVVAVESALKKQHGDGKEQVIEVSEW